MTRFAWFAVVVMASLALVDVRPAAACSSSCRQGWFVPGNGAHVPANVPALIWRAPGTSEVADPAGVTLTRMDTGATIALTATMAGYDYQLTPAEPLVAGVTYQLDDHLECALVAPSRSTFTVTAAAPLPTALGVLSTTPTGMQTTNLMTTGGSCSVRAEVAGVEVAVALDPAAAPWADVLHFETRVDGQPWGPRHDILAVLSPGASWTGRGRDLVYSVCGMPSGASVDLPQGAHSVVMRATLPGSAVDLALGPSTLITQCVAAAGNDGGTQDAGAAADGGGGCSTGGAGASVALGLALGGLLIRRRR